MDISNLFFIFAQNNIKMQRYPKDPDLAGIYVKRCKCGARPSIDRIPLGQDIWWIGCNCGRIGESSIDKQEAIDNWNNNKLSQYAEN